MSQSNITQEQIEFILKHCFLYKARDLSYHLAEELFDSRALDILEQIKQLDQYTDYNKALSVLKKEYFDRYYVYENISNEVIKSYLINSLSEFSHFGWGYRTCPGFVTGIWGPTFDGKPVGGFSWRKDTSKESWKWFPYNLSETILYNNEYDNAKVEMNNVGFHPEHGATVADYIGHNIEYFKPYALAAAEYLKSI